jgi:hypothetical protein
MSNIKTCSTCGNPVKDGHAMCEVHLEKRRKYAAKRRSQNKCANCNGPKEIGGYCKLCWDKKLSRTKQLQNEKKQRGECITCPNLASSGRIHCDVCRLKLKEINSKRKKNRRELNLCEDCGGNNPGKNSGVCGNCYVKSISVKYFGSVNKVDKLVKLLENQNFHCPYTGIELLLGHNASLDHKVPTSKGGTNEFENLQWVYLGDFDVNRIKLDMTEEQFKKAIKLLAESIFSITIQKDI